MAESGEAQQLKRRARRRLVGAIALVTFVVIILPLILDKEPGPAGPPLDVQVPRQDSAGFASRVVPPAPQVSATPAPGKETEVAVVKAEAVTSSSEPPPAGTEPKAAHKAATASVMPAAKSEQEHAQAAVSDQAWIVTLDAFSSAANVKQLRTRLSAAGVKSYTEPVKTSRGELTRVRAGPFASKEAAEQARAKLVSMGLKPGAVASR